MTVQGKVQAASQSAPWRYLLTDLVMNSPPFKITEEGWGEFDMSIILTAVEKGGDHTLVHDLNFQSNRYEAKHAIVSPYLPTHLLWIDQC